MNLIDIYNFICRFVWSQTIYTIAILYDSSFLVMDCRYIVGTLYDLVVLVMYRIGI